MRKPVSEGDRLERLKKRRAIELDRVAKYLKPWEETWTYERFFGEIETTTYMSIDRFDETNTRSHWRNPDSKKKSCRDLDARAELMAAAPELYRLVADLVAIVDGPLAGRALAVLAKARGEVVFVCKICGQTSESEGNVERPPPSITTRRNENGEWMFVCSSPCPTKETPPCPTA